MSTRSSAWARQARDQGLDSVWVHDSYFERDAVSFTTAIAQAIALDDDGDEAGFRVALGAANPFTRHPVVLAMTGSALDEILPGRIVMGLGTGLPLRLKQMGIPYEPGRRGRAASPQRSTQIRALWAGERLPSATAGPAADPADVPADPPDPDRDRRLPQGVRRAGRARRPTATSPGRRSRSRRCAGSSSGSATSAVAAGPRPGLDRDRRLPAVARRQDAARGAQPGEARAVRDLHDVGPVRRLAAAAPGSTTELRDRIAAAWRAEDYTTAGNLIPDELLDAFMLCGTREDVAAGAMAFHAETGLQLPLLQPVLQEDRQIDELIAAAAIYARCRTGAGRRRGGRAGDRRRGRDRLGRGRRRCAGAVTSSLADDRR